MAKKIVLRPVPDGPEPGGRQPGARAGRPVAEILAEIRKLYFETTAATVGRDFDRAIDLLKSIPSTDDRQRATVYMEGLAEMRREWKGGRR